MAALCSIVVCDIKPGDVSVVELNGKHTINIRTIDGISVMLSTPQSTIEEIVEIGKMLASASEKPTKPTEAENPWRYFHEPWGCAVIRVRRGCFAWRYHADGRYYEITVEDQRTLESWESWISLSNPSISELTEDEAAAIVGGRPWEESR